MTLNLWWLYVVTVFLVSATPGPNMLHVMSQSIHFGPRRALATMAGLMSAILIGLIASGLGLGAVLKAAPGLFNVLRYAGVAYLIYLGVKAWRAPVSDGEVGPGPYKPGWALYMSGLGTGLSNPKFIVFASALFPQFIDPMSAFVPQLGLLVATFVVIESFWYAVYAFGGTRLASWLRPVGRQRLFNRLTGGLFIGFGAALGIARA